MLILLLFMLHIALFTPCIAYCNSGPLFAYTVDPAEPEFEEIPEQVQADDTNPEPEQGKHWCIQTPFIDSCFIWVVYLIF